MTRVKKMTTSGSCGIMGLLLIPQVREVVLDPAVKVLTDGLQYSSRIIGAGVN